jgi:hypothetical protein
MSLKGFITNRLIGSRNGATTFSRITLSMKAKKFQSLARMVRTDNHDTVLLRRSVLSVDMLCIDLLCATLLSVAVLSVTLMSITGLSVALLSVDQQSVALLHVALLIVTV